MTNEPIYKDNFVTEGLPLRPDMERYQVCLDHSGFIDICRIVYDELCSTDRYMHSECPLSMWMYYHIELLHMKLNAAQRQCLRPHDLQLQELFEQQLFHCPEPIASYLNSIGPFEAPNGERFEPAPAPPITPTGDYGQFTPATSDAYQSTPAPAIAFHAIAADVTLPHVPAWVPPAPIPPVPPGMGQIVSPTTNLLGWDLSRNPQMRDRQVYTSLGFQPGVVPPTQTSYLFHAPTMQRVNTLIQHGGRYRTLPIEVVSQGMSATTAFLEVDPSSVPPGGKYALAHARAKTSHALSERATSAAFFASMRLVRENRPNGTQPYLGYRYTLAGLEVPAPAPYTANRNVRYHANDAAHLNAESHFSTPWVFRDLALRTISQRFRT
jgi:hypothetical protein